MFVPCCRSVANSHDFIISLALPGIFLKLQLQESCDVVRISAFVLKKLSSPHGCGEKLENMNLKRLKNKKANKKTPKFIIL